MSSFILNQILVLEPPNGEGLHREEQDQWPGSQAVSVHPIYGVFSPGCPSRH